MRSERPGVLQLFWYMLVSSVLLAVVLQFFNDIDIEHFWQVILITLLVEVFQIVLQPVFSRIAQWLGIAGILLVSLFAYAILVWGACVIVLGADDISFTQALLVGWLYALFVTLAQWIMLAGSNRYFLRNAIRTTAGKSKQQTDTPGFVFVQLDGVSWEVLQWQLTAGNLPNLQRLINENGYHLRRWKTQLPSTTPASQAGLLHGSNQDIPAFRWYERETGKMVVANQPDGAKLIEKRISTGKGLLADGGISVGNLFSGDATESILVISRLQHKQGSLSAIGEYTAYFTSPYGFMRAIVLAVGEIAKELFQARRQKLKDFTPRVPRHLSYVALRAATNVILRELQTTIVVEKMLRGANSIYVDYVDYDEIAHHAGVARAESLAALDGLDGVVGLITKAINLAPRPYHVVFLSDHGQSQGPTFRQLHGGTGLAEIVSELLDEESPLLAFTGSGNLGNIWLKRYKQRPTRLQLEKDYPGFLEKLVATDGIGLVIVNTGDGPVGIGKQGEINLKTGKISGKNPLRIYPDVTIAQFLKAATMKHTPDLQIISGADPASGEVYAFEELVGNHGGAGGWQTDAVLLHPADLSVDKSHLVDGDIVDSTTIHRILVDWLKQAGHRQKL